MKTAAVLIAAVLAALALNSSSATPVAAPPGLRVSDNHRFLATAEGKPFFWLADTAWQLIHDLNEEETRRYFADRRDKGFTVIQTVALAEARGDLPNAYGHMPIETKRPDKPLVKDGPDNDYWDDVDRALRLAKEYGLHVALLPTWGKWVTSDWQNAERNGERFFHRCKRRGLWAIPRRAFPRARQHHLDSRRRQSRAHR
jgi:hypothetical protein